MYRVCAAAALASLRKVHVDDRGDGFNVDAPAQHVAANAHVELA
jgi:hypothetical protein